MVFKDSPWVKRSVGFLGFLGRWRHQIQYFKIRHKFLHYRKQNNLLYFVWAPVDLLKDVWDLIVFVGWASRSNSADYIAQLPAKGVTAATEPRGNQPLPLPKPAARTAMPLVPSEAHLQFKLLYGWVYFVRPK